MEIRSCFTDDDGFTTAGVAIALFLVAALLFGSLHAFWVGSHSGEVQYVADAGALAADAVVADYVSVGQTVDAVLLSFSLLSLTIYAVSAVAAFIPGGQGVAAKLAHFATKIVKVRSSFAKGAQKGLAALQKALPLLCAARASECIQANAEASGIDYVGSAITLPMQGCEIKLASGSKLEKAGDNIEKVEEEINEESKNYQEAQSSMDDAKKKAWLADCGYSGMSMYERASHLANLSGSKNQYYATLSNWSFSVGLERAKNYYAERYSQEKGVHYQGTPEEVGKSIARKRFYAYAKETVSKGSIVKNNNLEIPKLQTLPRNTESVKKTTLYTESVYPVSKQKEKKYLHAYSGCTKYLQGSDCGFASVSSIDFGSVLKCPVCKFSATTLGRVPSASTSIDNGFEYYYKEFVEAANKYVQASESASESREKLDEKREEIANEIKDAAKEAFGKRYDPQPPGRYGCICIVASSTSLSKVSNRFFKGASKDSLRIAISGATLAADTDVNEADVLSSIGANLFPADSVASGISKRVFRYWSKLVKVYANGTKEIEVIFNNILGAIPVVGNELSSQAVNSFRDALSEIGMQPANLYSYKPIIVNTSVILKRDDSIVSSMVTEMKKTISSYDEIQQIFNYIQDDFSDLEWDEKGIVVGKIALDYYDIGLGESKLVFPFSIDSLNCFLSSK